MLKPFLQVAAAVTRQRLTSRSSFQERRTCRRITTSGRHHPVVAIRCAFSEPPRPSDEIGNHYRTGSPDADSSGHRYRVTR